MKRFLKNRKAWISVIVAVAIIFAISFVVRSKGEKYQFVTVARGPITEEVDVTGNTTPLQNLDLAFQSGGTVAGVYKNAGDAVSPGMVIARLDTSSLQAQLAQAQANVAAAQAKLAGLQAGPTPQNVQVAQTAVAAAQQTLANTYAGISNTVTSAFAKANDAVRNQISPFYSNAESTNPQLTFSVNNNQVLNDANFERIQAGTELNQWQKELNTIASTASTSTFEQALTNASNHLAVIENLLTTASTAIVDEISLSATTAAAYKTDAANAVTEVNSAATSISADLQDIASQKAAIDQAQAQLAVTLAGSTPQDIAAQQAAVAQAQASAQQIQVEINQTSLISPINGVITVQNAKVGQVAVAGQTITSVISNNNLEVDAEVPETDIGKVAVGNEVDMTFDAFPGETFTGKAFYIDPAETIVSGVVDYEIKVSFDKTDPRMKSGLTANLTIKTRTDQNALILPQYAVIQNASGTYVEVLQNSQPAQVPVTLGLRDQEGNVEVASGVTEGEQVINIGLKQP